MNSSVAWRVLRAVILVLLLALSWFRDPPRTFNAQQSLTMRAVPTGEACCEPGPLRLTGVWQLSSPNHAFGGYSALLIPSPGQFLAFSDRGYLLEFYAPGWSAGPIRIASSIPRGIPRSENRDIEAAAWDPAGGMVWLAAEGRNAIIRASTSGANGVLRVIPEWREWSVNTGPEAMLRLGDGRFVILCECRSGTFDRVNHPAFVFAGDPVQGVRGEAFTFAGARGYRPTDMALLPDGRVLVLMRQLRWPIPARFRTRIMLVDPERIKPGKVWQAQEIASLAAPLPVDNFEAMAIEPLDRGRAVLWLLSDDNEAVSQRTLLWRLEVDLAALPQKRRAPGKPDAP